MALSTANLRASTSYTKRETEKSPWSGDVAGEVALKIDDGVWFVERDGKTWEIDKPTREGLMEFAIRQVLADAYAGAADLSDAKKRFDKKFDNLVDGSWGADSRGPGVNEWLYEARNVVRGMMKADDAKAYVRFNKNNDAKAQNAALDMRVATIMNGEDAKAKKLFERKVEMRIIAAREAREAKRALAAKLAELDGIDLDDESDDDAEQTEEE